MRLPSSPPRPAPHRPQTAPVLYLLCTFFFSGALAAQEPPAPPPPPPQTLHVHVDSTSRLVYWPLDLPMWVRLSPSPEPDAPAYLLEKALPNATVEPETLAEKGIKLEIPGNQYVRWFNYVNRDTVSLKFVADGGPPKTALALERAQRHETGSLVFFSGDLAAVLQADDSESGVETVFYSIDGAPFAPYAGPLEFTEEKTYALRYTARDRVGYLEPTAETRFALDLTPPATEHRIDGGQSEGILAPGARVLLDSRDELTGSRTFYRIGDGEEQPYTDEGIALGGLEDGDRSIAYYSVDGVGNREEERRLDFYLDRTAPSVAHEIQGDHHTDAQGLLHVSPRTRFALSASDGTAGVGRIEFWRGGEKPRAYTGPFPLAPAHGPATVQYRAVDDLENASEIVVLQAHMDTSAPQSGYRFEGPFIEQRGRTWITAATNLVLESRDSGSGLGSIFYRLGDSQADILYAAGIGIPDEGEFRVRFWGVDRVENREPPYQLDLVVDNTPPTVLETFSISSTGADDRGRAVYPRGTAVFLAATDASSGSAGVWYSIDGNDESPYRQPLEFPDAGTFTLEVRAVDKVANETRKTLYFSVAD